MSCLLKKVNNESGVVLLLTLAVTIVIVVLSISILSQSISQTKTAQEQIDQICRDQMVKGAFWRVYSQAYVAGAPLLSVSYNMASNPPFGSCGGKEYTATATYDFSAKVYSITVTP